MLAEQTTRQIEKIRKQNGCRGIHNSIHSPHLKLDFCKKCNAYVQALDGNVCSCCKKQLVKLLKNTWLSRVLKFGVRQHHNFLRDWNMFPMDMLNVETRTEGKKKNEVFTNGHHAGVTILEIKYRDTVYSIPAKYLALALEPIEEDVKLALIKNHIKIKGFRVWIPDEEKTDVKCKRCDSFLRFGNDDKIKCPKCDK